MIGSKLWVKIRDWLSSKLGGRDRARVIALLAMTLGLDGADSGAVGSMATILEHHFSITKMQIGLLISVSKGIGIFSTLFFGTIVDRTARTRLLAWIVAIWGAVMLICGAALSYHFLLITRVALGIVAAATLPCVASLIGDYFPGRERGRIYGYVLSGEMIGTGAGFIVAGETSQLWWRIGFWVLALPSIPLAWWLHKLREPERGGKGALTRQSSQNRNGDRERLSERKLEEAGVKPRQRLVLDEDPAGKSIWWAIKFVLSIPTNGVLIICSALGYAFFAAVRTFGIQYAQSGFHLKQTSAVGMLAVLGIGAIAGVWTGGRLADGLLARGHIRARVCVATVFFWLSVFFFFSAFYFQILWISLILFIVSCFSLGAVNPPLDSARLDIIHPTLWGRAEAVRTIFRDLGEAICPVTFGWLVSTFANRTTALREGFLIMLIPLGIAGALALITLKTYPPDAAAAAAYRKRTMDKDQSNRQ